MDLKDKIDLLKDLEPEERIRIQEKRLITFKLVNIDEIKENLAFLDSKGINITKAKDIRILAEPVSNLVNKYNVLADIHEEELYNQDPSKLEKNVIEIFKNINTCKQEGISYRREDGTYESFLTNNKEWMKRVNKININPVSNVEEEIVTLEPSVETPLNNFSDFAKSEEPTLTDTYSDNIINFNDYIKSESDDVEKTIQLDLSEANEPIVEVPKDSEHIDINEWSDMTKSMDDLEAKTTDFKTVREQLENELAELDSIRNAEEINFNDFNIPSDSYEMRRVA